MFLCCRGFEPGCQGEVSESGDGLNVEDIDAMVLITCLAKGIVRILGKDVSKYCEESRRLTSRDL